MTVARIRKIKHTHNHNDGNHRFPGMWLCSWVHRLEINFSVGNKRNIKKVFCWAGEKQEIDLDKAREISEWCCGVVTHEKYAELMEQNDLTWIVATEAMSMLTRKPELPF